MVWEGPGFLVKISDGLNADLYINILKEDLIGTLRDYKIDKSRFILQQDNDPRHTARKTMGYLKSIGITVESGRLLEWPAQSPDLNPIEHLWQELNKKLGRYPTEPKGMNELWERMRHEWYSIDKECCRNLIRSMPARIQEVIRAKGRHTSYWYHRDSYFLRTWSQNMSDDLNFFS
jgi:transposase